MKIANLSFLHIEMSNTEMVLHSGDGINMIRLFKFEQGFSKSYHVKKSSMSFELRKTCA